MNKKNSKKPPLKSKQQKKVQAAVRSKNAHASALSSAPMPKAQKIFVALVACLCVFAISFVTLGTILLVDAVGTVKYASPYDNINLKKYVSGVDASDYTGQTIDLSSYYQAPYTLEDMDAYLKELRFLNRETVKEAQMTSPIGYGDDIAYYVIGVFVDGKEVLKKDFAASNYMDANTLTVGLGTFGDDFDEKLIALALKPADTHRIVRQNGQLAAGDVIAVSYTAVSSKSVANKDAESLVDKYNWNTSSHSSTLSLTGGRLVLDGEDALSNAIAANCKELGEPFTFVLENYDADGDGTTEHRKYEMTVHFAAEEAYRDVTFTLPDDYFSEDDFGEGSKSEQIKEYTDLNGKEITFRIIVTTMNDYEVPALTASFIKDTLEFETDLTEDAAVIDAFKAYSLEKLNRELAESLKDNYISAIYNALVSPLYASGSFGNKTGTDAEYYPTGAYEVAYNEAYEHLLSMYNSGGSAYYSSLEQFAINYVNGSIGQQYVSTLDGAASFVAEQMIAEELFRYWILDKESIKITKEMEEEAYREYVDDMIAAADDEKDEEYFIERYGKDTLYTTARRTIAVYRAVAEFLMENNDLKYGS